MGREISQCLQPSGMVVDVDEQLQIRPKLIKIGTPPDR